MMCKHFGQGLFNGEFSSELRKKFADIWAKMPDAEKLEIINKRIETLRNNQYQAEECPLMHEVLIEVIDERSQNWLKKTPSEKKTILKERKETLVNQMHGMHAFERGKHTHF